jgi:hypothetical protein
MATKTPTWQNTVQRFSALGHITEHAETALELGYPFILWNHRVYSVFQDEDGNVCADDMGLTIDDLK